MKIALGIPKKILLTLPYSGFLGGGGCLCLPSAGLNSFSFLLVTEPVFSCTVTNLGPDSFYFILFFKTGSHCVVLIALKFTM